VQAATDIAREADALASAFDTASRAEEPDEEATVAAMAGQRDKARAGSDFFRHTWPTGRSNSQSCAIVVSFGPCGSINFFPFLWR
jgi:hypothetical protein